MSFTRNIEIDDDVRAEVSSADLNLKEMELIYLLYNKLRFVST